MSSATVETPSRRSFPNLVNKADLDGVFDDFVAQQLINPIAAHANWGRHVRSYFEVANPNMSLVRYEDLHTDGVATLGPRHRCRTASGL